MKVLRSICMLIFGFTFILSGMLKMFDPVGTGLIVSEYLRLFHLGFLVSAADCFGMVQSVLEYTVGVGILIGLKPRFTTWVALVLTAFFTCLTLYLAIFNPIKDCGCFGEAIHLTNWQTFKKNVILLLCILILFFQRKKMYRMAGERFEWVFWACYLVFALIITIGSYLYIPQVDFTPYNRGTDMVTVIDGGAQYETTFTYSRDGETRVFTIDNLPDSTWTFVDSNTELVAGDEGLAQVSFSLTDRNGNDCRDVVLQHDKILAAIVYDPLRMTDEQWERLDDMADKVLASTGNELNLFTVDGDCYIPDRFTHRLYLSDRKTLLTLNRSNGGVVYFEDGQIIYKWASRGLDRDGIKEKLEMDADMLLIKSLVKARIFFNFNIVGTLLLAFLINFICKLAGAGKRRDSDPATGNQ